MTTAIAAVCTIRDADGDEADFCDRVAAQAGLSVGDVECSRVRVAFRQGRVAGFARVDGAGGELHYLFVHHDVRRSGIGRALLDDACELADGHTLRIVAPPPTETYFSRIGARQVGQVPPSSEFPWCRAVMTLTGATNARCA